MIIMVVFMVVMMDLLFMVVMVMVMMVEVLVVMVYRDLFDVVMVNCVDLVRHVDDVPVARNSASSVERIRPCSKKTTSELSKHKEVTNSVSNNV